MIHFGWLLLAGALCGAGIGAALAKKRGGARADLIHYATVYGVMAFVVTAIALTLFARG